MAYATNNGYDVFNAAMDVAAQQMTTRLSPITQVIQFQGENMYFDDIGTIEARRENGLNADLQFTDIAMNRRKMTRERIYTALIVDKLDVDALMQDPKGQLAQACTYAHERERDRVVYDAMFSTVYTGRNGGTAVTFAAEGLTAIDATSGLTYEKLLELKQNQIDYENEGQLFLGITGDEHTDLMGEVELTSGDYTRQFVVEKGEIQNACGIQMIKFGAGITNPILETVGGERISFAAVAGAVVFGVSSDRKIDVYPHPLKVDSTIIKVVETVGAVRKKPFGARLQKVRFTP